MDLSVFRPFLPIPSPPPRQSKAGTQLALERAPAGPLIPTSTGSALLVSFQTVLNLFLKMFSTLPRQFVLGFDLSRC